MNRDLFVLALFLFVGVNSNVFSQTSIDFLHNSMRTGDVVEKRKVVTDDIWNLSQADKSDDAVSESYEDFKADTITLLFGGMRKYYQSHPDALLYVGSEDVQHKELFYLPETACLFPMSLGDKVEGCFAAHIDYCDKMRFHKYGTYIVYADSMGTLTLPDESCIKDVLQICHTRKYMLHLLDTAPLSDKPIYGQGEIMQALADGADAYTEIEKEIYVTGYRYPVVKDFALYTPKNELHTRATYYYPLFEQECLPLDEANIQSRRVQNIAESDDGSETNDNVFSFVRNNPDAMEVVFDCGKYIEACPLSGTVQCRFLISDSKGVVYRTKQFSLAPSASYDVGLSYVGLRHGQYIISIVIGNQSHTTNFIIE